MQRYEAMVFELYTEPKEEIIVGKYLQTDVDITIQYPELQPKKKKKVAKKDAPLPPSKDIRSFFQKRTNNNVNNNSSRENRGSDENEAIIID